MIFKIHVIGGYMKKVMIIDDDTEFLEEISELLREKGYRISKFSEGESALNKVRNDKPDVILLDIRMDKIGGLKIADELKRRDDTKRIPIIGITGVYTEEAHKSIMKTFGIDKCFIKPLNIDDVISAIEKS